VPANSESVEKLKRIEELEMSLNSRMRLVVLLPVLFVALALQVQAQQKNEVGLVIGATTSPGIGLASGNVAAPTQSLTFGSSLALGAEYDRRVNSGNTAFYVGVDFLTSPLDVKLNQPQSGISPEFAYIFLTPHVRVKFNADGALKPWLSFGGGYARLTPFGQSSTTAADLKGTHNTGSLEFGGGIDTAPIVHVFRIPLGLRVEVRDFYSGTPNFNAQLDGRLNTVAYTGGLLLKF
jgi:hypothetical protein